MGQECTISAFQHVSIGRECVIADRVMLIDFDHGVVEVERPIRLQGIYKRDVRVGNNVWIGYGACILRGVTVGDNAIIGTERGGHQATFRRTRWSAACRRGSSACARRRSGCAGSSSAGRARAVAPQGQRHRDREQGGAPNERAEHGVLHAASGACAGVAAGLPKSVRTAAAIALIGFHSRSARSPAGSPSAGTNVLPGT